jgi:hypothetical protein
MGVTIRMEFGPTVSKPLLRKHAAGSALVEDHGNLTRNEAMNSI